MLSLEVMAVVVDLLGRNPVFAVCLDIDALVHERGVVVLPVDREVIQIVVGVLNGEDVALAGVFTFLALHDSTVGVGHDRDRCVSGPVTRV